MACKDMQDLLQDLFLQERNFYSSLVFDEAASPINMSKVPKLSRH